MLAAVFFLGSQPSKTRIVMLLTFVDRSCREAEDISCYERHSTSTTMFEVQSTSEFHVGLR